MKWTLFFVFLGCGTLTHSQSLPRQGNWGLYVNEEDNKVVVLAVQPGSIESKVGLTKGDVLIAINDAPITSISDIYFGDILPALRAGDEVCYHIEREGDGALKLCGKVEGKAYETLPKAEVLYDKVRFKDGFLSTIITKPKSTKKLPAVYFIPGYNCASYDNMPAYHPYKKIIDSLTNLGYAVFRCEKSGMGDSHQTPNCFDIDFYTEQAGFEAGYEKLLSYDFVDTSQIFVFGHSLGGINAPILAEKFNPKGVIVYGTTHLPWMEYLQNMTRFQNPRMGVSPLQMERDAKIYQSLLYKHYVLKQTPQELTAQDTAYERLLARDFQYIGGDLIFQRHFSFWQQLNDLELAKSWSNVESHVLSIYGEADFEALDPSSHKEIVRIVNLYHPDKATFLLLPETNHSFIKVGSMEDGVAARKDGTIGMKTMTQFNYRIVTEIHQWISSVDR